MSLSATSSTPARAFAAAALTAGVVFFAVSATAASALAEPETDIVNGQVVMVLDDTETSSHFVPKGGEPTEEFPEGEPVVGDAFAFTDDLRQHGELVGTDEGKCTVLPADAIECGATLTFAGGTVSASGPVAEGEDENAPSTIPITGGTGAYTGIKGTVTVLDATDAEDPTDTLSTITLRFVLPAEATQVGAVPAGGAGTGGGITGDGMPVALFAIGAAALVTGAGIAGLGRRLRG